MSVIVLTAYGTLGDLHPYLAIGLELKRRGVTVRLATCEYYRARVEALGFEFYPMRPDAPNFTEDRSVMRQAMSERHGSEFVIRTMMLPHLRASFEDLLVACAGADLLFTHPLVFAAPMVAESLMLPWVSGVVQPVGLFSCDDPPVFPIAPWVRHIRRLGLAPYQQVFKLMKLVSRQWGRPVLALRKELGLSLAKRDPLLDGQFSRDGVMAMFSRHLTPIMNDWPANTRVVGFPFYDGSELATATSELERFLAAGDPPITFTLGSAAVWDPGRFFDVSVAGARSIGARAVLVVGRDTGTTIGAHGEDLFVTDYAPYAQLFSRSCLVVHHGGIGTTGQTLRSGRPAIIVPFAHDQPDNAMRVTRLGVAQTIARRRYTKGTLEHAIRSILNDSGYAERAAKLRALIADENGAARGAEMLIAQLH